MKKITSVAEKTRERLIKSFWKLYKKNDINKINIGKLCENANYERTTFYRYFKDINDILNQTEDSVINNIRDLIIKKGINKKTSNIIHDNFKDFANTYGDYLVTFSDKGNTSFYKKFKTFIKEDVYKYMNITIKDENEKEFIFEFVFSSLINSFVYWYKNQDIIKLESFVNFTNTIILNGTKSVMSFNK